MGYKTPEARHADYLNNREKQLQQTRERYLANPEKYKEYQREYRKENRELVRNRARKKRAERMATAIDMLGGRCSKCLEVFDFCQYDFHHVKREEKEILVSAAILLSKERFFNEVKKCVLLCANCHRLEHKGDFH